MRDKDCIGRQYDLGFVIRILGEIFIFYMKV